MNFDQGAGLAPAPAESCWRVVRHFDRDDWVAEVDPGEPVRVPYGKEARSRWEILPLPSLGQVRLTYFCAQTQRKQTVSLTGAGRTPQTSQPVRFEAFEAHVRTELSALLAASPSPGVVPNRAVRRRPVRPIAPQPAVPPAEPVIPPVSVPADPLPAPVDADPPAEPPAEQSPGRQFATDKAELLGDLSVFALLVNVCHPRDWHAVDEQLTAAGMTLLEVFAAVVGVDRGELRVRLTSFLGEVIGLELGERLAGLIGGELAAWRLLDRFGRLSVKKVCHRQVVADLGWGAGHWRREINRMARRI